LVIHIIRHLYTGHMPLMKTELIAQVEKMQNKCKTKKEKQGNGF